MTDDARLDHYRRRRDWEQTPEPAPDDELRNLQAGGPLFVIQKHDASTLHYDFRLEVDGVLKSWAVPKGPSTDPEDKRLAVPTEDHPLSYATFEGVIPEGQYGAGAVVVWDRGTYRNLRAETEEGAPSMAACLDEGQVEVWLQGEKLRGGFALVRFREGEDEAWLLIKMKDAEADARRNPTSTEPESVVTQRTVEEVGEEDGW